MNETLKSLVAQHGMATVLAALAGQIEEQIVETTAEADYVPAEGEIERLEDAVAALNRATVCYLEFEQVA